MKNRNRSARNLNTFLNIVFWLLIARGIFSAGYHIRELYSLFTDPAALSGKMGLTIDYLTLDAANGFGIDLDTAVKMKLIHLISAIVLTVIECRGVHILKQVLLPLELNQPFRTGISVSIEKLSQCAFHMGLAENVSMLATTVLIENHYALDSLLVNGPITGVSIHPEFRPAWLIVAVVLGILSTVFRQGEELQQLSDETL